MSDNGRLIINAHGEMFQVVKPEAGPMKGRVCLQVTSHVGNLDTVPGGQFTLSSDLSPSEAIALACKLADAAGYAANFTRREKGKSFAQLTEDEQANELIEWAETIPGFLHRTTKGKIVAENAEAQQAMQENDFFTRPLEAGKIVPDEPQIGPASPYGSNVYGRGKIVPAKPGEGK